MSKSRAVLWRIVSLLMTMCLARAGDVEVKLDDAAGTSAFYVVNSQTNLLLKASSDSTLQLGEPSESIQDQIQWTFSGGHFAGSGSSVWQSFTVGRHGRLSHLQWWHNYYFGPGEGTLRLWRGEGTNGTLLWSKAVVWNDYAPSVEVDADIVVSTGEMFTIEAVAGPGGIRSGYGSGNPYPRGRASTNPDQDFMFATYVTPPSTLVWIPGGRLGIGVDPTNADARLAVNGNVAVSGSVTAGAFCGDGAGLANVGPPPSAILLSTTPTNRALEERGYSLVFNTEARDTWQQVTGLAGWSRRKGFQMVSFQGRLWVVGGLQQSGPSSEVWSSADGTNWTLETSSPGWSPREGHAVAVFSNALWLLGGLAATGLCQDVWSSSDGVTWTAHSLAPGWAKRAYHAALAFGGKLWVLGGSSSGTDGLGDVWFSTNGMQWTCATTNAPWPRRTMHCAVVYQDKMWVLGGYSSPPSTYYRDVWFSADGITWTEATSSAGWTARAGSASQAYDGRMWILGGWSSGGALNDIWSSLNGTDWTQVTNVAAWPARAYHGYAVHDSRMWIAGGENTGGWFTNDVWRSGRPDTLGGFYLYQKQ